MSTPVSPEPASSARQSRASKAQKPRRSVDGSMSLVEHIQELRRRLLISLAALAIGTVLGFLWYQHAVFGVSLGELLKGPYCKLDPSIRADFSPDGTCKLLATAPFEMFMLRLKVGSLAGLVLSSPVWLTQLWGFITPGLMKNERRWTFTFVSIAVFLFVIGACLAYFVMSYGLEMLLQIGNETQITALSGERYYSFFLALLLVFGVSFEVPLIIVMLNIIGVLEYDSIKDKRRIIIMVLFMFAAFMTPGQDPFSMVVLALSLCLLVEMALQFAKFNDKRRAKKRPDWLETDNVSASKLDLTPGGVDGPSKIDGPNDIDGPSGLPTPAPLDGTDGLRASDNVRASGPIQATPSSYIRGNQDLGSLSERPGSAFDDVL